MTEKHFRTQKQRNDLVSSIAHTIPIGYEHRMRTVEVAARLSNEYRHGKTEKAFIKEVERICLELHASADREDEDELTGLLREGGHGKRTEYYWSDNDSRIACVEGFTITQPRALALFLVKEHISELLPTNYLSSLEEDFEIAQEKLKIRNVDLSQILDYSPFGVAMANTGNVQTDKHNGDFDLVFEALLIRKVLVISYNSIHEQFDGRCLTVSPQKLRFLNNQLQLLGYVHEHQALKHFVLTKMHTVKVCTEKRFIRIDPIQYESSHRLTLKCHTWVKEFLVTRMLSEKLTIKKLSDDVWEVSDIVKFPRHFKENKPDGFYLANFLSMFADALQVKEPAFLRNEMIRRSQALHTLYTQNEHEDPDRIIRTSPDNIASQV